MANLSSPTGSLINNIMVHSGQPVPEVGMGATICMYTDRYACTVTEIRRFKTGQRKGEISEIIVQEDSHKRTDKNGMSDCQSYEYNRDPNGRLHVCRMKQGRFQCSMGSLSLGHRDQYHDFSF